MSTPRSITPIVQQYREQLASRQISEFEAHKLGLKLVSEEEASSVLGYPVRHPGILIPFSAAEGSYFRIRMLGGATRYRSAKNSGIAPPFMSALAPWDWSDVKVDISKPVVITEGEFKSIAGCKVGLPTLGLGGVDMYETLFTTGWEWHGRAVMICYDHDLGQEPGHYKPGVANALGRLASRMRQFGANVKVLHLGLCCPDPEKKWGLDDYLHHFDESDRSEAMQKLLGTLTDPPEWCEHLAAMLVDCAYVVGTNHTHIYNLKNGSRKSPTDFHDTHIEKKRWEEGPDGKMKVKQVSKIWIEHPSRVTVDNYTLDPRLPFGVAEDKINLWKGYPVWPSGEVGKRERIKQDWQKFMEGLFGEHWKWVGLWTAHMLNRPWERSTQAVMLVTMVQGIGKSLYGDIVRDLVGEHGLEGKASSMFGNFNADMEAKTFIMINELDVKFSSREGQLNDLLTEEFVRMEQKGKDVIILPNLRRWYLTTNASSPCRLSKGQRRVLVINPPRVVGDTRGEWGTWVREEVAGWRKDDESLGAIREWFDDLWWSEVEGVEGGVWDATAPVPETEAALEAAEASMTVTQIVAEHMYEWICAQEDGVGAVHPDLRKRDVKAFGDLTALVKAHGGFVGQKTIKEDGVVKAYTVYDTAGKLTRLVKPSSGSANMQIDSDTVKAKAVAIAGEYVKMVEILTK